jgi:hypothetical protein
MRKWMSTFFALFLVAGIMSCKNPDQGVPTFPVPGTPFPPGDDPTGRGDPPGRPGPGGQDFTPFVPDGGYTGTLLDVSFAPSFPEIGAAIMVLDSSGVHIFNTVGREVFFRSTTDAVAVAPFLPFPEVFAVYNASSSTTLYNLDGLVVGGNPFNYLECHPENNAFDFFESTALGNGAERIGAIGAPPRDGNSGGVGPVALAWDIYGNFWIRGSFQWQDPFNDCPSPPGLCEEACPGVVNYIRGINGPNANRDGLAYPIYPTGWDRATTFTGSFPGSVWGVLSTLVDLEFDSQNRMVFSVALDDWVGFTDPVPDWAAFINQQPPAVNITRVRGFLGANTGSENPHLRFPWGILIEQGTDTVYVADTGNDRIVEFDNQGNFRRAIRGGEDSLVRGLGVPTFLGPIEMELDPYGRMFIIDRGTDPQTGERAQDLQIFYTKEKRPPLYSTVRGKVTDIRTGNPIFQAVVTLYEFTGNIEALTDEQGEYAFTGVEPGQRSINVDKPGYLSQTREFFANPGETMTQNFALVPKSGTVNGSVSGRVLDADTGLTISGARVTITDLGLTTFSGRGGLFFIPNVPPGVHTLLVTNPGYEPLSKPFAVAAGQNSDVGDLRLKRTPNP